MRDPDAELAESIERMRALAAELRAPEDALSTELDAAAAIERTAAVAAAALKARLRAKPTSTRQGSDS